MVNIFAAILVSLIFVWFLLRRGERRIRISQDDSYAAGLYIPKGRYNYTAEFYQPLFRMLKPYFRDFADEFYLLLVKRGRALSNGLRKIYCGDLSFYITYIVLFLAVLIILKMGFKLWQ